MMAEAEGQEEEGLRGGAQPKPAAAAAAAAGSEVPGEAAGSAAGAEAGDAAGGGGGESTVDGQAAVQAAAAVPKMSAEEQAESTKKMMNVMWKMTVIDVEKTLRVVVAHVLRDETVSLAGRRRRAEGIAALGRLYVAAAQATGDIEQRAEVCDRCIAPRSTDNRPAQSVERDQRACQLSGAMRKRSLHRPAAAAAAAAAAEEDATTRR
jgi:hypothetical protein